MTDLITGPLHGHGKDTIQDALKEAFQWETYVNPEMMRHHHKLTEE